LHDRFFRFFNLTRNSHVCEHFSWFFRPFSPRIKPNAGSGSSPKGSRWIFVGFEKSIEPGAGTGCPARKGGVI
jgi:hypothetical protein